MTYTINGVEFFGVQSTWNKGLLGRNIDGTLRYSIWSINTWSIPIVTQAQFNTLVEVQGSTLVSLGSNNPSDFNAKVVFSDAINTSLSSGTHLGNIFLDIVAQFRVLTTVTLLDTSTNTLTDPEGLPLID